MESEPTTLEPVPDPPATEERHLRLAAAVLAAVATAVVALLLAFPDLRTSAPGDLAGGDRASTAKSEPAVEAPAALLNRITAQLLAAWRGGRFDADLFAELADVLDTEGHHLAGTAELHLLREWAAGGSSLAAGDDPAARHALDAILANPVFLDWIHLLPGRFVGRAQAGADDLDDWRLAVFWGDPRGEAAADIERMLADKGERRSLLLGRAVVAHLDGEPARAAEIAIRLEPEFGSSPQAARLLARFIGDELLWSGDRQGALSWYKKVDGTASRGEVAAILHVLYAEGGRDLLAEACDAGVRHACEPAPAVATGDDTLEP